jgi:hypothetical protein
VRGPFENVEQQLRLAMPGKSGEADDLAFVG